MRYRLGFFPLRWFVLVSLQPIDSQHLPPTATYRKSPLSQLPKSASESRTPTAARSEAQTVFGADCLLASSVWEQGAFCSGRGFQSLYCELEPTGSDFWDGVRDLEFGAQCWDCWRNSHLPDPARDRTNRQQRGLFCAVGESSTAEFCWFWVFWG